MPSPLYDGAGYIRHPKKSGTKEEVLARVFSHLEETIGKSYEVESKEERMGRHADNFIAAQHQQNNEKASLQPTFQIHGPHLPHYTDDRSRVRLGRFGHRISD